MIKICEFQEYDVGYVFVEDFDSPTKASRKKRSLILNGVYPVSRQKRSNEPTLKTSFEWYAYVGPDTERYRSTILAGTNQQHFQQNFFNNPLNSFEITTVNKSR